MNNKIILDLCGGTGSWSKPYKDAGYDVRLITLPDHDVRTYEPPENVYGILAAPPCTEFSIAKGSRPRDFEKAMTIVKACMEVVWTCRTYGSLRFWALENPVGFLRQFLGRPAFTFEPWWFGDFHSKKTDLWGYFKEPKRKIIERPMYVGLTGIGKSHNGMVLSEPKCPPEYKHLNLNRAAIRAITPPEFAKAFYKANL